MFCYVLDFIIAVVHGHERGPYLCTCLVYAACVMAFVAYVNGDNFSVMYLILLY